MTRCGSCGDISCQGFLTLLYVPHPNKATIEQGCAQLQYTVVGLCHAGRPSWNLVTFEPSKEPESDRMLRNLTAAAKALASAFVHPCLPPWARYRPFHHTVFSL
jgi:hypothetical protein